MAAILTVDQVVRDRVRAKMKKYNKQIKAEVLKEAKKKSSWVRGVKSVSFSKLVLPTKKIQSLNFGDLNINTQNTDVTVFMTEYSNGSDTTDHVVFERNKSRASSWHWEITAGVTFSYKATAGISDVLSVEKAVEINFSATYGEAVTETKNFNWHADVGIEPHKKTIVNAIVKQVAGTLPFVCTLVVDGSIDCVANLDIKTWPDQSRDFSIPLQRLLSKAERTYTTNGVITGASGTQSIVEKRTEPLTPKELKAIGPRVVEHLVYDSTADKGLRITL